MAYNNDKKCKKKSVCCQEFNLGKCMPEWNFKQECARTLSGRSHHFKHIMGKFPPDIWRLLSVGIKAHAVEFVLGHNRYKIRHIKSQMISPIMPWFSSISKHMFQSSMDPRSWYSSLEFDGKPLHGTPIRLAREEILKHHVACRVNKYNKTTREHQMNRCAIFFVRTC